MTRVPVLDTSFLIDVQRGHARARELLERMAEAGEDLIVPHQVVVEFLSGVRDAAAALRKLEASFIVAFPDRDHALAAAEIARAALRRGAFPGWSDASVAAHARLESTYVLTADARHYADLECDHWDHRNAPEPRVYGPT